MDTYKGVEPSNNDSVNKGNAVVVHPTTPPPPPIHPKAETPAPRPTPQNGTQKK